MKRGVSLLINHVKLETFIFEVRNREGLISLSRDVHHADSFVITVEYICTIGNQETNHVRISVEACKMKRCKTLNILSFGIYQFFQDFSLKFPLVCIVECLYILLLFDDLENLARKMSDANLQ